MEQATASRLQACITMSKTLIIYINQSYVIKSAPWTVLWFRILGIFSVDFIKRLCVFMFKTCSNSQLLRRVLWISAEQPIGASLKHKNTQPLYMFNRVRVLHLNRLKERTWWHSFDWVQKQIPDQLLSYCTGLWHRGKFWMVPNWSWNDGQGSHLDSFRIVLVSLGSFRGPQ